MEVAAARRLERPAWLNLRTCLGLLLFTISLLSGWTVLAAADSGREVWALAVDLSEGTTLSDEHLTKVNVDLSPEQLGRYLSADTPLVGATLLRPHRAGELVPASAVTDGPLRDATRIVTVPVGADHAAGGELRPGDRVDVFASLAAGRPGARTVLLVSAAEVEALVQTGGVVMDDEALAAVTLQVSPEDAARLAFAIRSADVDIVRVVGGGPSSAVDPITETDL